jgi:ATP phosphoribosyltransferase
MITLALSKGRIFEDSMPLLRAAGIEVLEDPEKSRKLIIGTSRPDVRVVLVRAFRRAHLRGTWRRRHRRGRAGRAAGTRGRSRRRFGRQPVPPAGPEDRALPPERGGAQDFDYAAAVKQGSRIRVATKYTQMARQHFAAKGVHVDLIKLYGSMELAPLTGLADAIVDLVSTGSTLKANHLLEVEHIMDISSRLVVNPAALKLKREPLRP